MIFLKIALVAPIEIMDKAEEISKEFNDIKLIKLSSILEVIQKVFEI